MKNKIPATSLVKQLVLSTASWQQRPTRHKWRLQYSLLRHWQVHPCNKLVGMLMTRLAALRPDYIACRFGFNNGKTMVDGLDAERTASWEGGDFATIVQQLRLLGFNAV